MVRLITESPVKELIIKQRVSYNYDFEEDEASEINDEDAITAFEEDLQSVASDPEFIKDMFEEKASAIKSISIDLADEITARVSLNYSLSDTDINVYFDRFIKELYDSMDSSTADISYSGTFEREFWNGDPEAIEPSTEDKYYEDLDGEVTLELVGEQTILKAK